MLYRRLGKNNGQNESATMNIYIKVLLILCLGFAISFTSVHASSNNKDLEIIYHVYVDGEYIGKVDNASVIQEVSLNVLDTQKVTDKNMELVIGQSIDSVPEKVFNPSSDNDKVSNTLKETLTVQAKGYAIVIENEIIGQFATEEIAEDVLKNYKLEYMEKSELHKAEQNQEDKDGKKETQEKESELGKHVIKDVDFSKDVSIVEENTEPKDIMTLKQGEKLISNGTLEDKKHKIVAGDVFEHIAKQYDLTTKELLELNPDFKHDSILQIDEKLNVTVFEPYMDVVVLEEVLEEKKDPFDTKVIKSDEMYKGEEEVKQTGKDGKKEVLYEIEKTNGSETNREVLSETITKEPVEEIIIKGTKVIPSQGSGNLSWPVDGGYVSSKMGKRWGRMHRGIDIAQPDTRTISAADHGVVEFVGMDGSYGNKIVINHNNAMKTIYAHLSSMDVKVGQAVEKGMRIGVMGSTGNSTGVHLHFEVHKNGSLKNPLGYF